jgi:hypothetical protein
MLVSHVLLGVRLVPFAALDQRVEAFAKARQAA